MSVDIGVCISSQSYSDWASTSNLLGWWTFDDDFGHDSSKYKNPLKKQVDSGPSFHGKGFSAYFNGSAEAVIPHISYYETTEFTISFWAFLIQDSTGSWRSILHKGANAYQLTPSILLWPKERRLSVRVSTAYSWHEGFDSRALINMQKWTQISLTANGQLLQLFINGILDSQDVLKGYIKENNGDYHIGKDPWHIGFKGFIDDLRIYGKIIPIYELIAISTPSLPLAHVQGPLLGCQLCTYMEALAVCNENYHICSLEELYAGVWEMGRQMGWYRFTSEVWTRNTPDQVTTSSDEMQDPNLFKACLCCTDE